MKKTMMTLLLALALLASTFAAGKAQSTNDDDYVVKIGYGIGPGLCSVPFFIALEKGYFAEEGLKYEVVNIDIGQIPLLLTNGSIDITNNLLAGMIQPIANGLDIKIPLALHTGCIKALVKPDSPIRKPADLKGKKIGVPGMGAPGTIIVQRYLAEEGISTVAPNLEVEWVVMPGPELPLALERGLVDAIVIGDPVGLIAEKEGRGRAIINTTIDDYLKDEFCCVIAASSAAVKNHPAAIAKVIRAVVSYSA
jgi:NitT/TauT family transport system substrate-binding protein